MPKILQDPLFLSWTPGFCGVTEFSTGRSTVSNRSSGIIFLLLHR